ncbi:MAG: 1-deoxy-D-xylulose 5-phosphate reductoisomerase [Chloroflexota bacterium]|nr:MAG: 1-deoxy-D-xylulose 5-phosphate reductoisomerase [Chloroflexota bacterium]
MKKISILGSTGSVGTQCLEIISEFKNQFEIISLTAGKNEELLGDQIKKFKPKYYLSDTNVNHQDGIRIKSYDELLKIDDSDLIVIALSGISGFFPVLNCIKQGRKIALANKESLVACGDLLIEISKTTSSEIIPLDSEHSAIWQCIKNEEDKYVKSIVITASGGSLRDMPINELSSVTPEIVLNHPTWNMGDKITVDSATLINKVFEVKEAANLFDIPLEDIEVIFHDESIIHGMANMVDGNSLALLSEPNMRIPILYALFYPKRVMSKNIKKIDLTKLGKLSFRNRDKKKLNFYNFGIDVISNSNLGASFLVGSDQAVVENFLEKKINYLDMLDIMKSAYKKIELSKKYSIETSIETINDSYKLTKKLIHDGNI